MKLRKPSVFQGDAGPFPRPLGGPLGGPDAKRQVRGPRFWQTLPRRLATRSLCGLLCLSLAAAPVSFAQSPNAKFRGEPVTLNFVNADIEGVTRAMAAILRQQFVVDPRVKGTITLYSEEPLSPREAYLNFLAALRGLGFTVVEVGGIYKVVPEADAKLQAGTVSVGEVGRRGDQVITQIFKLNHESANNLVPVLRPLISPNNTINANPGNNSLVITDYADNLQRIAKIIAAMDTPASGDVEVIPIQHAVASDLAPVIQRLTDPVGGGPQVPGLTASGAASILVDSRSNTLLVRAPNPSRLAAIRALVDKLDRPVAGNNPLGNIWVVYLKNADAVKLAAVLRAAYGGGGGGSTTTSTSTTTPAGNVATTTQNTQTGAGASPQATAPIAPSAGPSTGGFVQADPSTNSLIITAPEPMYRQLRAVIDQLDSRRAQVYIESMIVKVDATKAAEFGFQWQGPLNSTGDKTIGVAGTNFNFGQSGGTNNIISLATGIATGNSTAAPGAGLNVGVVRAFGGTYTLTALARFLETNADGNILSTPNLVTLDNEEAKIVIGQNVPFITGSFTNTGSTGSAANPFQTIERKDVGLTLRIKPQVGEGGTVRMTIYQENSSVDQSSRSSPQGLITDKSAIETNVVIDDGQIMVLGGLLKDEFSGGVNKVPLLGDIPLVGNLFKTDSRTRTKSNLMVFLRPIIVRTQDAANSLTLDRYDAIRALQQNTQPNKSYVVPVNESPIIPPLQSLVTPPAAAASTPPQVPAAQPSPVPAPTKPK